jgi:hypothetical protein
MCLRWLVVFQLCLAGGARRIVRINDSYQDAKEALFPRGFRKAVLRHRDSQDSGAEAVDAAMLGEALDRTHLVLAELTESPTKLQRWLQQSDQVQDLAQEDPEVATLLTNKDQLEPVREVLEGVKRLVGQKREIIGEQGAMAAAAAVQMTDVLAKAADFVSQARYEAPVPYLAENAKEKLAAAFAPKAEAFQVPVNPQASARRAARSPVMETTADVENLAKQLNPVVGYWDPLNLAGGEFWDQSQEATIGFLRHAEIKHGRVAMAAFVGYIVQANGIHFPWKTTLSGITYDDIAAAGGPADQWDALPTGAKLQIILFVGFLELLSENNYVLAASGNSHYMRGGKPGAFPSLKKVIPHPIPFDLFDPFGFQKGKSDEWKSTKLLAEINNGRLAMLGIMAFLAESKVPGSVPALGSLGIKPYAGEIMAPFASGDAGLPFVSDMLSVNPIA